MKKIFFNGSVLVLIGIITTFPIAIAEPQMTSNVVPLPPSIASLHTIAAEPWLQVEPGGAFLEGPASITSL